MPSSASGTPASPGVVAAGRALDHDLPVLRLSPDPGIVGPDVDRLVAVLAA
ncbi:MAG TPA: hypothetical protein VHW26_07150 [Solirubrobacteraceae bacterium]|jgi:hypothetical protein|nr:hypothetical protein [Solirubrobacteraceae bacterium]